MYPEQKALQGCHRLCKDAGRILHPFPVRSAEKSGKKRYEGGADQGDPAAGHELLHALGLRARVIVAVALEQVDRTPDAESGSKSDDKSLQYTDC